MGPRLIPTPGPIDLKKYSVCSSNVLKQNWLAKCFVREKLSWRAKEEWKHDIVYDPKGLQGH